ncbi:hypothetical protein FB567DRAFT_600114 [Paraphoma chrysanthemicola]|uniref:Uncharacterized protein n=1 Tax=Paraphoma chrysanthemicola TaxID=798071 RepID=A0A8K0RIR8_9PLEO|nr:hypothetical protein FB567DRAFT_600114 [Paraphoma chrysanthemicola]
MSNGYNLVASRDQREAAQESVATMRINYSRPFWVALFAGTSLLNVCFLFASLSVWRAADGLARTTSTPTNTTFEFDPASIVLAASDSSDGLAKVEALPIVHIPFYWNTPWGAPNTTESDALWKSINTAHGHIAVEHRWAAANNWSQSMDIPGKPGKGMYLLQAYHQLHCLRIVRSSLLSLHRSTSPQYTLHHILHCFDALRQHIMCHADNTPLYGHGDGMAGDGQLHQCKDWGALRDFATRNTACFRDGEPGMTFEDRFGVCDDGTDGLEAYAPGELE